MSQPTARKKVLFFYPDFGAFGGIERFLVTVSCALDTRGHFEPVVVCSAGTRLFHLLQDNGIKVYGVKTLASFAKPSLRSLDIFSTVQLVRILKQEKPDLVHIHIGQIENRVIKQLGFPLVYSFHGYSTLYSMQGVHNPVKRFLKHLIRLDFKRLVPYLDAMLFVSRAERDRLKAEGYLPPNFDGEILHNGLPILRLQQQADTMDKAAWKAHHHIPEQSRCITFINRLDQNKNPMAFIELAERLFALSGFEDLHVVIAGSGPLESQVQARIRQCLEPQRYHFLGHRTDIAEILACSDLHIHIPFMEGFGLGVLEALAVGTPCLAHATGGIVEILDFPDGQYSLVPVDDVETLFFKSVEFLSLPAEARARLCQAYRARAMMFDETLWIDRLETIYRCVLERYE